MLLWKTNFVKLPTTMMHLLTGALADFYMGTISKALNLLNIFTETTPELGLGELQNLSGQNKATVHRHLVELLENGFLEQNSRTRKYRLGAAVLRLAAVREMTFPMRRIVEDHVNRLSEKFGELAHAALVQGRVMSPLYFNDAGHRGTRVYFDPAEVLPMHATSSGIAALAFGAPKLLKMMASAKLEQFTDTTIVNSDVLMEHVLEARAIGYAYVNQSYEAEVNSVAVPFYDGQDFASGTISIAVPTSRMNEERKLLFAEALWEAAGAISIDLGGRVPQHIKKIQIAASIKREKVAS